jgi:hypothetical protein
MTLLINEASLAVIASFNVPNIDLKYTYGFVLTSQYSHEPLILTALPQQTNDRYSVFSITFPTGFGDAHKNGIYDYYLSGPLGPVEKGLVKIVTNPGGGTGITNYTSTLAIENRVAEVFYRPNYTN